MDASRLHATIRSIIEDFEKQKVIEGLSNLQQSLQDSISQPSDSEKAERFTLNREALAERLRSSETNGAPPIRRTLLDLIGASPLLGQGLLDRISDIVDASGVTPASALKQIQAIVKQVRDFYNTAKQLSSNLDAINIASDYLGPGEAEVGVAIPPDLVDSTLEGLQKEMHRVDQALRLFKEAAAEDVSSATIRAMGSSDFELYLALNVRGALFLASVLGGIVMVIKRLMKRMQRRRDMSEDNVPRDVVAQLEEWENRQVEADLDEIVQDLIGKLPGGAQGRTPEEMKTVLAKAVRGLAGLVRRGVVVQVEARRPSEPPAQAAEGDMAEQDRKALAEAKVLKGLVDNINDLGRSLTQLEKADRNILLRLPEDTVPTETQSDPGGKE